MNETSSEAMFVNLNPARTVDDKEFQLGKDKIAARPGRILREQSSKTTMIANNHLDLNSHLYHIMLVCGGHYLAPISSNMLQVWVEHECKQLSIFPPNEKRENYAMQ